MPLLGVIDYLPLLSKPSLADIESVLNAKLISGGERRAEVERLQTGECVRSALQRER